MYLVVVVVVHVFVHRNSLLNKLSTDNIIVIKLLRHANKKLVNINKNK